MGEPAPTITAEALKRRSTRIARAVPLLLRGVEALGRHFEERTSTSIVNCHGCRYSSRHYVARDRWVTLEMASLDERQDARRVRGRVAWIERPRALRDPFQYGVELEVSGNFWALTSCPGDWFVFPGGAVAEAGQQLHAAVRQQDTGNRPYVVRPALPIEAAHSPSLLTQVSSAAPTLGGPLSPLADQAAQIELEARANSLDQDR